MPGVRLIALVVVAVLVAAACGTTLELNVNTSAGPEATQTGPTPGAAEPAPDPDPTPEATTDPTPAPTAVPTPTPLPELGYDEAIDVYFADVELFWGAQASALGIPSFTPVTGRFPYDPDDEGSIPPCGGELVPRRFYVGNAFYCIPDDYIAWDNVGLFPDLYDEFGDFTVGLVIAHEYGHAIQQRASLDGPTIFIELQADCFAGAWAGDVSRSNRQEVRYDPSDVDETIGGFLTFADPLGTADSDPQAHGTAFDRLNAFADGFTQGVDACPRFLTDPPETASLMVDLGDANEGNLPLEQLLPLLIQDLTTFLGLVSDQMLDDEGFQPTIALEEFGAGIGDPADCGGISVDPEQLAGSAYYCEVTSTVAIDRAELEDLWRQVGDFAPAYAVAHAYATSVAAPLAVSATDIVLIADCIVGVWARAVFEESETGPTPDSQRSIFLSAGDLDEGIVGLLLVPPTGVSLAPIGQIQVFDRVTAFSDGFFSGSQTCAR